MTERTLFRAYRNTPPAVGYSAECSCGDLIQSTFGDELSVQAAIDTHNLSAVHQQWRSWQEAVRALQRPPRRPCPCHGDAA